MKTQQKIFASTIIIMLLSQVLPSAFALIEFERPHWDITPPQSVYSVNSDDNASIALGVVLHQYDANNVFDGHDCVHFNVSVMANTRNLDYFER
ncbi:MAG: hypothetical protein K6T73_08100 [Candidatus Bathyarchaeota archaeon]|nr:hypothetical protein [Candidatus Bathyarchaeota archaeon]